MNQLPDPEQPSSPHLPYPHQQGNSWMPQDGVPPAYLQQQYGPAWQVPGNPNGASNKKILIIVLGAILGVVFLMLIVGFFVFNSLSNSEGQKIGHMKSIADRLTPGEDWVLTYSSNPKVDPTCIPSNVSCHKLERMWEMPNPVNASEVEEKLGVSFSDTSSRGCPVAKEENIRIELCIPASEKPQVTLLIQD